ncbi:MAG TPA: hypothetical protein VH374_19815 [Polyangia bacterium]|jgi:hypothetical protein|nr:hypothetical protein [Polyangia bacterium]
MLKLGKEMKAAGLDVDLNLVVRISRASSARSNPPLQRTGFARRLSPVSFNGQQARADVACGCGIGRAVLLTRQPAKKTVTALLEGRPDDGSLEDVLYHLYVIQKVEAGWLTRTRED